MTLRTIETSNSVRFAAEPLISGGTPAAAWLAALKQRPLPRLDLAECPGLVVVAPHPDDETLGLGATVAQLVSAGVDVQVVSVTDGGAANPGAPRTEQHRLETTRRHELRRAASILGAPTPVSLGLPDGRLSGCEDALCDLLTEILESSVPHAWCAATWRGDGHPDHEAVGRATAAACGRTGAVLLEYPVWMWHWAKPGDPMVPWDRAYSVPRSGMAVGRKQLAAQCFRSQFEPASTDSAPILPSFVLPRLLTVGEVLFR